jgi:hypothetical protein
MSNHAEQNPVSTCEFPSSPDPGRVLGIPPSPNFGRVIRGQTVGHCEPNHQMEGAANPVDTAVDHVRVFRVPLPSTVSRSFQVSSSRPIGGRREGR